MRLRKQQPEDVIEAPAGESVVYDDRATAVRAVAWSPAQLVALVAGIGFVVLGIAALAKTGSSHLYSPQYTVWHLGHSPLLGWIDVAFGGLMVLAAAVPGGMRSLMALLGAAALAFGIVILVDAAPNRLHRWLGVTHTNGWLYVGVGAAVIFAAFFSPVFFPARRHVHRRPGVVS